MTEPQPGDFGVVATYGAWLDRTIAKIIRWDTQSPVNHAFVYIGLRGPDDTVGCIIEAQPGGAVISPADKYGPALWSSAAIELTADQRTAIVQDAHICLGVGYGWLDIVAIAFVQRRWHNGTFDMGGRFARWAERRVSSMRRLICSQLVDSVYESAGVHLFTDGRPSGLVSPGDLGALITAGVVPAKT